MSEYKVYLIPQNADGTQLGKFSARARAAFEDLSIIDGYYDRQQGLFDAGHSAGSLFKERILLDQAAFLFADIYESGVYRFIPEAAFEGMFCVSCENLLDEEVNEVVNTFYGTEEYGILRDMRSIFITCPYCDQGQSLEELSSDVDRVMTNRYIKFCDIDGIIDEACLSLIQEKCGYTFKLVYAQY